MRTSIENDKLIIYLEGRIDSANAAETQKQIDEAMAANPGCRPVIDADEQHIIDTALADEKIKRQMQGMQLVKTIVVKNKIINLILKPAK